MINQILLDTNIYRQLGLDFDSHIDFVNLKRYCYGSGSEIRLSNVVLDELIDFYTNEIIDPSIKLIQKSTSRLNLFSVKKINNNSFSDSYKAEIIKNIKSKIQDGILFAKNDHILERDLIDFLIANKQNGKKDNTRDFLIFLAAVKISSEYPEDQIVIISSDNIFTNNDYFKTYLKTHQIENIKTYLSIASFLSEYSQIVDFVTPKLLAELITKEEIKYQINQDIDAIPSHISYFYYSIQRKFSVEKFDVRNLKVSNYYSFKELDSGELKILFHVITKVNIVFEPEKDIDALNNYLSEISNKPKYNLETFDSEYRPIYNTEIMFIYTVSVNDKTETFENLEFIDFFPDYYHIRKNYYP